jgi:Xaa-Pro aminopeptidase
MCNMTELDLKLDHIKDLLAKYYVKAVLLQQISTFAWATCGASSYINMATNKGESSLLITQTGRYLITNNIEAPRFEQEEQLAAQGWELCIAPWYEKNVAVAKLTRGLKLAADGPYPGAIDLSHDFAHLRANLMPEEGERFRALSRLCAGAMDAAICSIRPGMTEFEIAGILNRETQARGVLPIVNLIATDERIFKYRHPLPTDKSMDRYAMLVLSGRKWGLVSSLTRLVHFGELPDDLRKKVQALAKIDATFIAATRPGKTIAEIFRQAKYAYKETGYPTEWQLHHQGGPAAYEPREWVATPASSDTVNAGQAYAWNPSITGTKSEDTILIGPRENEVMTKIAGWPTLPIEIEGQIINRPAILEVFL